MPSSKHVVSVRLNDHQADVVARFAGALGMSRGGVVVSLLEDMIPYMERMAEAMTIMAEADEKTKEAAKEVVFRKMTGEEEKAEHAEQQAMEALSSVMSKVDFWAKVEAETRRRAPAPRGVPARRSR